MDPVDKSFRPTISWALNKKESGVTECVYGVDDNRYVVPAIGSTWVLDPDMFLIRSPSNVVYHVLIVTNTLNLHSIDEPQVVYESNTGSDSVRSMPLIEWPRNLVPE